MSDNEGATKKSGYRLEYATSARAKCKGAKPCAGTPIPKGTLRMGSVVDIRGNTNFAWRHWGCTTPRIITNMKAKFSSAEDLDGFEDLKEEDQERVRRAWEEGRVADEDIPETARKPADAEDDEKPKKKRAPAKKKNEVEGDEEGRPKKRRATKSKKTDEEDEDEAEAEDFEEKPKSAPARKPRKVATRGAPPRVAPRQTVAKKGSSKRKAAKDESEASGEDFEEELAQVEDEEEDDAEEPAGKKRKRPASTKQVAAAKKPRATSSRAKKSKAVVEEDEDDE